MAEAVDLAYVSPFIVEIDKRVQKYHPNVNDILNNTMSVPGLSKTHFKRNTEIGDVKLYASGIPYIYNCNERYQSCKSTKECKKIAKITQK